MLCVIELRILVLSFTFVGLVLLIVKEEGVLGVDISAEVIR